MKTLTELAAGWKTFATKHDALKANYTSGRCDGLRNAADQLEAWIDENMQSMVPIKDGDEIETPVMLYSERCSISNNNDKPLSGAWLLAHGYTHHRPLGPNDAPETE